LAEVRLARVVEFHGALRRDSAGAADGGHAGVSYTGVSWWSGCVFTPYFPSWELHQFASVHNIKLIQVCNFVFAHDRCASPLEMDSFVFVLLFA
jgi:hypothetical protein